MPRFAADEDSAHRAAVADARLAPAANFFRRRQIRQIRAMPFPRVQHLQPLIPPKRQQPAIGLDRPPKLRNIIAEHLAKSPRLEKVALHIDDQQRAASRRKFKRIRLGIDADTAMDIFHCSISKREIQPPFRKA